MLKIATNHSLQEKMKKVLAISSLALGIQLPIALAEVTPDNSKETHNKITIVGVRASVIESLEQKREAVAVSDSISAEDIGKFPDLNLSESLQRIPGVTLNRTVNGEGQAINVRGLGPQFTRVEINGMSGTGNGSGGRFGNSKGGRGFNFELLASELFNNATISKTISASQVEGGLAGTVSLETPKPLNYTGNRISASIQASQSDITGNIDPRSALFVSSNINNQIGIAASLAFSNNRYKTDTIESGSFRPLENQAGAALVPNGTRYYNFTEERENLGSTLTFQYKPSSNLNFIIDGIYAKSDSVRIANRDDMPIEGGQSPIPGTATITDGVVTSGQFNNIQQRVGTNYFTTDETFSQFSSSANWTVNDNWLITPFIGFSNRKSKRKHDLYSFRLADTVTNTFDPGIVSIESHNNFYHFSSDMTDFTSNPEEFLFNVFILRPSEDEDKEVSMKLDFQKQTNYDTLATINFGLRYADRNKKRVQTQERLQRLSGVGIEVPPNLSAVSQLMPFSVSGVSNIPSAVLAANPDLIHATFYPDGNPVNGTFIRPLPGFGAQNSFGISEKSLSTYIQANFFFTEKAIFNVGIRYAVTHQKSSGSTVENIFKPTERITPISSKNRYAEFLPSANLRYEITDDLILRAAYSQTLTRANFPDLAPSESIRGVSETDGGTGSRGNPELNPLTSNNYDVAIEWYFEEESILSATLFYKDVKNLIDTTTFIERREFPRQSDGVIVTGDILFTQPVNGNPANIKGFEFAFQKSFLDNFGLLLNYTFADSASGFTAVDDVRRTGLTGLSRNSYNLSAYYDDNILDARLSYAWRDRYLADFTDNFGQPRFTDQYGQFDLSANYRINQNFLIQLQILNLTNEQQINQTSSRYLPYGIGDLDRRFFIGVRYSL